MNGLTMEIFQRIQNKLYLFDEGNYYETRKEEENGKEFEIDSKISNMFHRLVDLSLLYIREKSLLPVIDKYISSEGEPIFMSKDEYKFCLADCDPVLESTFEAVLSVTGWRIDYDYCFNCEDELDEEEAHRIYTSCKDIVEYYHSLNEDYAEESTDESVDSIGECVDIINSCEIMLENAYIVSIANPTIDIILSRIKLLEEDNTCADLVSEFYNLLSDLMQFMQQSQFVCTYREADVTHFINVCAYITDGYHIYYDVSYSKYYDISLIPKFYRMKEVCGEIMTKFERKA